MSKEGAKRNILYVHNGATTFVRKDQRLLSEEFTVLELPFVPTSKWQVPFLFVQQLFRCLLITPRVDAVVCQFAGHHSLLPLLVAKLFRKPSMVLSNGSDCVSFPSLGYGHFRKPLMAASTRWSFRLCDLIVPLHKSLEYAVPTYHDIDGTAQGIRHFCKDLRTPIAPLGYGFDSEFWKASEVRLPKRFITVASNAHKPYIQVIKGLDMIMQVAPRFPDCEFLVVGAREGSLPNKPSNVIEVPFIPNEELPQHYGRASFYLQLSVSEGFGNALCEAMLCGCIPIVSNVGAMPEIVGDAGVVVARRSVDEIEAKLKEALIMDRRYYSEEARNQIKQQRPQSLRSTGLNRALKYVMDRGRT